jgi:ATP-dependent DNA helicase RecG
MTVNQAELERLLTEPEGERLEFKAARTQFGFEKAVGYCAALANEGGGKLILGVTDKRPRQIVGTNAFRSVQKLKSDVGQRLHLIRVDVIELNLPEGRVLILDVPSRPLGLPVGYNGQYLMRRGEELVPMTQDMLRAIFEETGPDFSAASCRGATIEDIDPEAIARFRELWYRRSGNSRILKFSDEQLLKDAELVFDDGVTCAALILLGTRHAIGRFLGQAEVIFEYRNRAGDTEYRQRETFRSGFLSFVDELWDTINLRNDVYSYQEGLFRWQIPTFNEQVVREALLNALSHRDYRSGDSIRILQSPDQLKIISPGGLPPGVTPDNILWSHSPRNKRVAEQLERCGLVERSGQGMDRMYEQSILEAKPLPDFDGTNEFRVVVTLSGLVRDPNFLAFLERVGRERLSTFSTEHFMALGYIHREEQIPNYLKPAVADLREGGIVEVHGRGRGTRYLLARQFYEISGTPGAYTRRVGLDRETNRQLLLKHIRDSGSRGTTMGELLQVVPFLNRGAVQSLLRDLRKRGEIHNRGVTRGARWYPGAAPNSESNDAN